MRPSLRALSVVALACALSLAGCGNDPVPDEKNGCAADTDCTNGRCDVAAKACVECLENTDCSGDRVCTDNTCQAPPVECTTDLDCEDKELQHCSTAKKCEWACTTNDHCPMAHTCIDHVCEPRCSTDAGCTNPEKPRCNKELLRCQQCVARIDCGEGQICQEGACVADVCSSCAAGQFCFNGEKCLNPMTDCEDDTDCKATEVCLSSSSVSKCFPTCDPSKNLSDDDDHNPACMNGYGLCFAYTEEGDGYCTPPQDFSQNLGEECWALDDPTKPGYNDCRPGLSCMFDVEPSGRCWTECDPEKNADPEIPGPNPDCPTGSFCVLDEYGFAGCDPRQYTRTENETCDGLDSTLPDYNHCVESNLCLGFSEDLSLCVKPCNPTAANSGCAAGSECLGLSWFDPTDGACIKELTETRLPGETCQGSDPRDAGWNDCIADTPCLDGVCGPTRTTTQELGAGCGLSDSTAPEYNNCIEGLACYQQKCAIACDPAATEATTCPETDVCFKTGEGKGVCRTNCDTANGVTVTTECPAGSYCASSTTYKPGLCNPLPAFKQGPVALGGSCSNYTASKFCDGAQNLFCSSLVCVQACKVGDAESGCTAEQECVEAVTSPIGGLCRAKATQELGQACAADSICKAGLYCDSAIKQCVKTCNPANNVETGNPGCAEGDRCAAASASLTGGYCKKIPTTTQPIGAKCLGTDPTKPEYNDCAEGLACDTESTPSVCVTAAPLYAKCGTGIAVCSSELMCAGTSAGFYCFDVCTPSAAETGCGAGLDCVDVGDDEGVCVQTCTDFAQCTTYGTKCMALGETKYCL